MEYEIIPADGHPAGAPIIQTKPYDPWFGEFLQTLRGNLAEGVSEFGTGLTLFSLAVSIRAKRILEIGRNTGFSTLALASALRFIEMGWDDDPSNKQRATIDYTRYESQVPGMLYSIDVVQRPDAVQLIKDAGLEKYVEYITENSLVYSPLASYDLMFIDGDHSKEGCLGDVERYVPHLRPGGYFILHDYYGWFDANGKNNSPIKAVIEMSPCIDFKEQILLDTGYQSLMIFHRPL